jgi:hypothetical protein
MANQKMCPSGHIIPAGATSCPICQSSSRGMGSSGSGSDQTRVDFDLDATRIDSPPTLFVEKGAEEGRILGGWLAVLDGNLQGESFRLYEGRNLIGSSPQCDIRIADEGVQDQHMSLRLSSGKWMLTDLDSDGGTVLNGKRVHRSEVKDGDKIKIGKAILRIKMF